MNKFPMVTIPGEGGDFLRIKVFCREHPHATDSSDANWLMVEVSISATSFRAQYHASFRSEEFASFLLSLKSLASSFGSPHPAPCPEFSTTEGQLSVVISSDALGHLQASCVAVDQLGGSNRLEFRLAFDQSYLPPIFNDLEAIVQAFPVLYREKPQP